MRESPLGPGVRALASRLNPYEWRISLTELMFSICAIVGATLLLCFGFVLWTRGYREINGDSEGTGVAWISAMLAFSIGLLGLLFEWRHWQQEPLLFCLFLFQLGVGGFQIGLVCQALVNGYIRAEGEEGRGVAADSLYTLLIMPSGETISRNDRPGRFWFEVLSRAGMGLILVLFPTVAPIYRSFAK